MMSTNENMRQPDSDELEQKVVEEERALNAFDRYLSLWAFIVWCRERPDTLLSEAFLSSHSSLLPRDSQKGGQSD